MKFLNSQVNPVKVSLFAGRATEPLEYANTNLVPSACLGLDLKEKTGFEFSTPSTSMSTGERLRFTLNRFILYPHSYVYMCKKERFNRDAPLLHPASMRSPAAGPFLTSVASSLYFYDELSLSRRNSLVQLARGA